MEKFLTTFSSHVSDGTKRSFERFAAGLKPQTRQSYMYAIAGLCEKCGVDFLDLTAKSVEDYFSVLEREGYADSTMKWQTALFRSFGKWLDREADPEQEDGSPGYYESLFHDFPFSATETPPETPGGLARVDRVLGQLKEDHQNGMFAAVVLAARCGFTTTELCSLTYEGLLKDDNGNVGTVFHETEDRFVKIPEDCVSVLSAFRTPGDTGTILKTRNKNMPFTPRYLQINLKKACRKAGVEPFTFQNLRNLAIGTMLEGGAPVIELSKYIGTGQEWIPRYYGCIPEFAHAPVDYSHVRIRYE